MLKLKAKISGEDIELILDTGIGVNLISKSFCQKLDCKINESLTGKRMTGQSVTIPISQVESLSVAGLEDSNVDVGVVSFKNFLPNTKEFTNIQGYLSLNFFKERPFTIDYRKRKLIFENSKTVSKRTINAELLPITKKREGLALTVRVPVAVLDQKTMAMQLDLGTNVLTLNNKYLENLSPYFDRSTIKEEAIVDETGFKRKRTYVKLKGNIKLGSITQKDPTVMFQDIIYDGIIGNDFFKGRVVTYDLANSRLILEKD